MNPFGEVMRDGTEIAALFIGLAALGLVIVNAQGAGQLASSVGSAFSGVLATATFQNKFGNPFNQL